jgi:hypothetical protein
MLLDLVLRFVLGGLIISVFSCIAETFEPKTFAGIFGAAPSVALATLSLAFAKHGALYTATEGRSMVVGALALLGYSCACVAAAKRRRLPIWLGAGAAWGVWFALVFVLWKLGTATGILS